MILWIIVEMRVKAFRYNYNLVCIILKTLELHLMYNPKPISWAESVDGEVTVVWV
jgi:hypothetical protein